MRMCAKHNRYNAPSVAEVMVYEIRLVQITNRNTTNIYSIQHTHYQTNVVSTELEYSLTE